jgi:hypothetical protein|tara:strand:- start:4205 stop:4507 length:303 start_codon:yes stop_codon:yes gene_type:complete
MNDIIKKLRDRKILNTDSLVQSTITKDWMGSPVDVQATLIVKELGGNHCICQEYREADGKAYKIKYLDITTIDGQEPNELAAVYGLGPKTARFYKRKSNK